MIHVLPAIRPNSISAQAVPVVTWVDVLHPHMHQPDRYEILSPNGGWIGTRSSLQLEKVDMPIPTRTEQI